MNEIIRFLVYLKYLLITHFPEFLVPNLKCRDTVSHHYFRMFSEEMSDYLFDMMLLAWRARLIMIGDIVYINK